MKKSFKTHKKTLQTQEKTVKPRKKFRNRQKNFSKPPKKVHRKAIAKIFHRSSLTLVPVSIQSSAASMT